jgi:isoleucyl-tRNA synthetase
VRFPVVNPAPWLQAFGLDGTQQASELLREKLSVVIWTTTPWTLPANQAVCLNANLEYALVRCTVDAERGEELVVIAADLQDAVMSRYGSTDTAQRLAVAKGSRFEHALLRHPFVAREVPVLLGDHVTIDAGTGAVHTAPDHGMEDFVAGQAYGLGTLNYVDENGVFVAAAGELAGDHVYKVDEKIVQILTREHALVALEKIRHSYPHCWRTKTPLIYRATPQWFISMTEKGLLGDALDAVKGVQWIPEWGQARIELMLKASPDWCVSRQRTWGVPITLFAHRETGALHPRTVELVEQVAKRIEVSGIDAWFELDASELLGEEAAQYSKVTDTLDVWFDSGVTHYSVLEARADLRYPADLYLEGSDQHRGWFQSSLKTAIAMNGNAPYKQVLTHGFTVDAEGRKMSKSIGNTISPQEVFNEYGADIMRLWVAATDYRGEMAVSPEILKRVADAYRRIRNTARFLLSNLNGFDPATDAVAPEQMLALDYWITRQTQLLREQIKQDYQNYQFLNVYQKVHNFCVNELGSFYLDIIKDRQYTAKTDGLARRSTQTAMYHITEILVRLIAPVLSFTADEIWEFIPGEHGDSVFLSAFDDGLPMLQAREDFTDEFWRELIEVKTAVNKELEKQRMEKRVGAALSAEVALYCDAALLTRLSTLQDELRFVLIVSAAVLRPLQEAPDSAALTEHSGLKVQVSPSQHTKCVRCWHHRPDVGQHAEHPEICGRCVDNIAGAGETRRYA